MDTLDGILILWNLLWPRKTSIKMSINWLVIRVGDLMRRVKCVSLYLLIKKSTRHVYLLSVS